MKNADWFVTRFLMRTRHARDGIRALREDATLAQQAASLAELPRRHQAQLRDLYLAPQPTPIPRMPAPAPEGAATKLRGQDRWIGPGIGTVVVCCAVVMIVVAVARTHVN